MGEPRETIDYRWRPMDTAPLDGFYIEILSNGSEQQIFLVCWDDARNTWVSDKNRGGMQPRYWREAHPDWECHV